MSEEFPTYEQLKAGWQQMQAHRDRLQIELDRERESHVANLREWQKCEAEVERLKKIPHWKKCAAVWEAMARFDDFLTERLPDGTSWWSRTPVEVLHAWIEARKSIEPRPLTVGEVIHAHVPGRS